MAEAAKATTANAEAW